MDATVVCFESRRAEEMRGLIERHGGRAVVAPSMREVPVEENGAALELLRRMGQGEIDVLLLLTGVGFRALSRVAEESIGADRFVELLGSTVLVARGPKPVAELRKLDLVPHVTAAEPNTWRELLEALDDRGPIQGSAVAIVEYGEPNAELLDALSQRGAEVEAVQVYRWDMPEDREPMRDAVAQVARRDADYVLFTSSAQVDHVMQTAEELGLREAFMEAADDLVFASVGPICSDALRRHGLPVHLEPEHPKMGHLVVAVARHAEDQPGGAASIG